MAAKLLEGLKVFQARKADENSKEVRPEGLSGKQAKRQAKAAAKQSIYVEGAEQIVRIAMPATSFLKAHYMEEFEALVQLSDGDTMQRPRRDNEGHHRGAR